MSNLDDKLRAILGTNEHGDSLINERITQIKQAFADAGYADHLRNQGAKIALTSPEQQAKLSGAEWYSRFEKEYEKAEDIPMSASAKAKDPVMELVEHIRSEVMKAAKRAAGLEDTKA